MLKQYELLDEESRSVLVVWLEQDPRVKLRKLITLKEVPDRKWRVMKIFDQTVERSDIKRGWNNNI